jgi:NAD(P)-dependent dehydrogenase (short-subunit alcohol dehydrogenase family)
VNLQGRAVAITGAASGIGAALAEEAVSRGAAAVAVIDIDAEGAKATAEQIEGRGTRSAAFTCDIGDTEQVEWVATEVVRTLGIPGLVCANAGVNTAASPLLDGKARDLQWALSVNVVGTWATLRAFGQLMVQSAQPSWLLVTASEHAIGIPFAGNGFYTLTKHAVLGLADVLRRELPTHVGVSTMIPGLAATGLWRSGSLRPDELGGPEPANDLARELLARGMDPALVAARALDGVAAERFLIATHPHAKRYFDDRAVDVATAFDALARARDEKSYDVEQIVAEITAQHTDGTRGNAQ